MAGITTSFQIGRSAIAAYQAAISVVGQNIANVGNPDYTRQSARFSSQASDALLSPGLGVRMSDIEREIDGALEARLRTARSERSAAELESQYLSQVESLYNELTTADLSTELSELFAAFGAVQSSPEDLGTRNIALARASSVIETLGRQRHGLVDQIEDMNQAATVAAREVTRIAQDVANLNTEIAIVESDGATTASSLRDQRASLLRDMSRFVDTRVQELDTGAVNVYLGSEPLVEFNRARPLEVVTEVENDVQIGVVRFADSKGRVIFSEGELAGLVGTRDGAIVDQIDRLDQLARGLIFEVNKLHSSGSGLSGLTSVLGTYSVDDASAVLNSPQAGLDFPPSNGVFIVNVRDTLTGQVTTRQIEVDLDGIGTDTTLDSLANDLNGVAGLTATVTSDNRLQLSSGSNTDFWFSDDTSGALAALGVGTFFTGNSASTIGINAEVERNPNLIAASASGARGNGGIAGEISLLADQGTGMLAGLSPVEFQAQSVAALGIAAAQANSNFEARDIILQGLTAQREAISGVSLDEEALNLSRFERAFEGASRYLSVVEEMSQELLSLLR